jgi:hypothetical protein
MASSAGPGVARDLSPCSTFITFRIGAPTPFDAIAVISCEDWPFWTSLHAPAGLLGLVKWLIKASISIRILPGLLIVVEKRRKLGGWA